MTLTSQAYLTSFGEGHVEASEKCTLTELVSMFVCVRQAQYPFGNDVVLNLK